MRHLVPGRVPEERPGFSSSPGQSDQSREDHNRASAQATEGVPMDVSGNGKQARRILVVDDNKDSADTLAMFLRLAGHEVHVAYGGVDALAMASEQQPQVVLLDIAMPEQTGLETARRLRAVPALARARLIAISGFGHQKDRDAALEAGFDAHLTKPVDTQRLHALLS